MVRRAKRRAQRGQGSIVERDGKWIARWSRTEGGKRERGSRTFVLRGDAEWWLAEFRRHGEAPDDPTLAEHLETWLAGKRRIRASTRLAYREHIDLHIVPVLGGYRLSELRRRHVEAFVEDRLKAKVGKRKQRPISPSTVAKFLTTLRSALEDAVPQIIPDNPAAKVETPKPPKSKVTAMTPAYASDMVAAVRGTWLEHIVRVLLGSGMRLGEAVALDQVDVQPGFVRLRKSKTDLRAVRLSVDAQAAIEEAIRLAPRRGPHEPVFFGPRRRRGEDGQMDRLHGYSVTRALPFYLKRAGLEPITPHKVRHGTATLMVRYGVPMRAIADQLGHANASMTANTYAHVAPDSMVEAMERLDEALKGAVGH